MVKVYVNADVAIHIEESYDVMDCIFAEDVFMKLERRLDLKDLNKRSMKRNKRE